MDNEILKQPVTIENLQKALESSQHLDNNLKDAYFNLKKKVQYYEQKFNKVDVISSGLEECQKYLLEFQKEYHETKDSSIFSSDKYRKCKEEFSRLEQLLKDEGFFDIIEYKKIKNEISSEKIKVSEYVQLIEQKDREISLLDQYLSKYGNSENLRLMKVEVQKTPQSIASILGDKDIQTFKNNAEKHRFETKNNNKQPINSLQVEAEIAKLNKRLDLAKEMEEKLTFVERHLSRYEKARFQLSNINELCLNSDGTLKKNVREEVYKSKREYFQAIIKTAGNILRDSGIHNRTDIEERMTANKRDLDLIPSKINKLASLIKNENKVIKEENIDKN